jgi:hypothetical protein
LAALPHDDPSIEDSDRLIRRINPNEHIIFDNNRKCNRISSKLYSPSSEENGGMSVDIESLIIADSKNVGEFVTGDLFIGSVVICADVPRSVGLLVGKDPILPENPYHGEVWGSRKPNYFKSSEKKTLADAAIWFVQIPGVELK